MSYLPDSQRYETMKYNHCGRSGLKLPALSLGFWHNFGGTTSFENCRAIVRKLEEEWSEMIDNTGMGAKKTSIHLCYHWC